jgi:hypothetical protein
MFRLHPVARDHDRIHRLATVAAIASIAKRVLDQTDIPTRDTKTERG